MQDIRLALRRFSRSPGLWVAVIVSIGLGVGANATIFSIVSSFLLRPPAVGEPATLVSVFTTRHGDCCGNDFLVLATIQRSARSGPLIFRADRVLSFHANLHRRLL